MRFRLSNNPSRCCFILNFSMHSQPEASPLRSIPHSLFTSRTGGEGPSLLTAPFSFWSLTPIRRLFQGKIVRNLSSFAFVLFTVRKKPSPAAPFSLHFPLVPWIAWGDAVVKFSPLAGTRTSCNVQERGNANEHCPKFYSIVEASGGGRRQGGSIIKTNEIGRNRQGRGKTICETLTTMDPLWVVSWA